MIDRKIPYNRAKRKFSITKITAKIALIVSIFAVVSFCSLSVNAKTVIYDDFSTDTGLWTYIGDAYRDTKNGYVVLTEPRNGQVGVIWLKEEIRGPFTVKFRYKAGGGTGADGLVFVFYKDKNYAPSTGGGLGFTYAGTGDPVPGYGIEFDNYLNPTDPSANHVALIKDDVENHLIWVNDARTEDNKWHYVTVEVNYSSVKVILDEEVLFTKSLNLNRTFGGIGFSASTGSYNNWHIIDNVEITYEAYPSVSISTDKTNYTLGESLKLHLTISGGKHPIITKFKLEHEGPEGLELLYESNTFTLLPDVSWKKTIYFPIPVSPFVAGGLHSFIATLEEPTTGTIIARDVTQFYINDSIYGVETLKINTVELNAK